VKRKCQETSDNLKEEISHLTINFNVILTITLIFVTVNIHNILLWLNMEMSAPMVSDIFNNALFHSSPRINQTLHQILHVLHVCTMDSLLNYDPDFVVNWIEVRAVPRPQIWTFIGVTMISEIIALLDWMQQMMHKLFGKHIMRKRTQPENLSNRYCGIATYITNSLQTSGKPIILFISSRRTSLGILNTN